MKAIIIDDEKAARSLLQGMIQNFCPEVEVIEAYADLVNGVEGIKKLSPDVVFLDIEMPGQSGLEILEYFDERNISFSIIFTTAYQKYAVQAFKISAVDYLLKPIDREELEKAIEKVKRIKSQNWSLLKHNMQSPGSQRLALPTGSSIKFVPLSDILFFKADGSYTNIYLENGDKIMVSKSLKTYDELLQGNKQFYRCHKSFIVQLSKVTDFVKSNGGYLIVGNKHEVGLSNERAQEVLDLLKA